MIEYDEHIKNLPAHLKQFVVDQEYDHYTAIDHAVWRYVMRKNYVHMAPLAHESYIDGLKKAGLTIDSIPTMYGMNRILKQIGWGAAAVDGFIPPNVFMEFQAYKVLVIAMDIRTLKHIEYTPAPDIIHEAAGHAPIIADPEYADYLIRFGEIGSKAFSSSFGYEQYEAIRHLSIIKENPNTLPEKIKEAELKLLQINKAIEKNDLSEMALIRRLHWWTVEYGLVGTLDNPKIYGAGLLSSIGEGINCLKPDVVKLPYSIKAQDYEFDITKPQPQLFVTPSFTFLTEVLEKFAEGMAFRTGGLSAIKKAIESKNLSTVVYSSGLQVSGIFTEVLTSENTPVYIRTNSPTSLASNNQELDDHGKSYHKDGFGSPVGALKDTNKPLENMTNQELFELGIDPGKQVSLLFASGVHVSGKIKHILRVKNKVILIAFEACQVTYKDMVLFQPEWGIYDMAVGTHIISAFPGAADQEAYGSMYDVPEEKTHKIAYSKKDIALQKLYQQVRDIREKDQDIMPLQIIWQNLKTNYTNDWLLPLEILELITNQDGFDVLKQEITDYLKIKAQYDQSLERLIHDGLELLETVTSV